MQQTPTNSALPLHKQLPPPWLPPLTTPTSTLSKSSRHNRSPGPTQRHTPLPPPSQFFALPADPHPPCQPKQGCQGECQLNRYIYRPCPSQISIYIQKISTLSSNKYTKINSPLQSDDSSPMSTSSASTKISLTNQKFAHLASPLPSGASLPANVAHTFRQKSCLSHAPLQLCHWDPQWNQPHHQHNAANKGKYISLSQSTGCIPTHAAIFFNLTYQFNSVSRKAFLMSLLNHSLKCSHSPPSSTNMPELSSTSWPVVHGALYSWKRASARVAHSLTFLHPLLLPTSSNHLTLN